jgi:glycosyltransferase involved in cell wall biosynthesis
VRRAPRLCYVVTHPISADLLLRGQLAQMRAWGFDVSVIASAGAELDRVRERERVRTVAVPMSRDVRLHEGGAALLRLAHAVRGIDPDIVNASTPKAGLLGMLVARALRVPSRVYLVRGLRLEGSHGIAASLLGVGERTASACAHRIVCVSESLRRKFVAGSYAPEAKTSVIPGNGVDPVRFRPAADAEARASLRGTLGIPRDAVVFGFVGRLVADKGAAELIEIAELLAAQVPRAYVLVVGGDLAGDALPDGLKERVRKTPRLIVLGRADDTAPYYRIMDSLLFPSYREGLPNVVLEAAASGLATIGYRSTGVVDAVADGETGTLVAARDRAALWRQVERYATHAEIRDQQGRAARERVLGRFTHEQTWQAWGRLYAELLRGRGWPWPIASIDAGLSGDQVGPMTG